jgi:drug/metabolite transporter (DMT)-like permease
MPSASARRAALALLLLSSLLFSTNVVIGRGAVGTVGPWTLAFLRWVIAAAVLAVICRADLRRHGPRLLALWPRITVMATLSMVVCGGVLYVALTMTTATNGTLIYTTSSLFIILIERMVRARPISGREWFGLVLAFAGVLVILLRGEPEALLHMRFGPGDLIVLGVAIAWAAYSVLVRAPVLESMASTTVFAAVAIAGAILLLVPAVAETVLTRSFPATPTAWLSILGLAIFSSVFAFSAYQHGISVVGSSVAGMFLLLMPPFGVAMAVLFLGERLEAFHVVGMIAVMAGVAIATLRPARR